jgi:RNA ligase (TIGR02306 family)
MSTIETKIIKVTDIKPHPNGDRLSVITIGGQGGFECVVGRQQFSVGDLAIYIMPDSVIPEEMNKILAERNKIQIKGGRIRPINIRGLLSEGLCLTPSEWLDHPVKEGDDITEELGITKYEPPPPSNSGSLRSGKGINFHHNNENFKRYNCVEQFKKHPGILSELGQDVVITTKFHGQNYRAGLVSKPKYKKTWWQTIKGLFIKEDTQEFLVGSHNTIKKPSANAIKFGDYYNTDTWWKMAKQYNLESVVRQIARNEALTSPGNRTPDVAIYGELIGPSCQKNYSYGIKQGEFELRIFDIMIDGKFCDWDKVVHLCECFNLPTVDELYRGPWNLDLTKMAEAVDIYNGIKHNREGIVVRPLKETWHRKCGRVLMKYINHVYAIDKRNTEYH